MEVQQEIGGKTGNSFEENQEIEKVAMATKFVTVEQLVVEAKKIFKEQFGEEADIAVFAPGRVNLIGEHTDYNDGFVMPMALPLVTVMVGKKVEGSVVTVYTTSKFCDQKTSFDLPSPCAPIRAITPVGPKWVMYIKGVIVNYIGDIPPAFNAVVHTNVPIGGGLSSSASLEVATYVFLDQLTGTKAIGHLTSHLIPLTEQNVVVLITNSNVKHELTGSEYPTRRKQCEEAALLLKKVSLRDANLDDIKYLESINTNKEIVARARHVITEIKRTSDAAEMLKQKNFLVFGELMNQSHVSLRDDYQVSCPELDSLVELALEVDGVIGSRMTGGGFGGCTVTLVYSHAVDKVIENIQKKYKGNATFYVCKPSAGASVIS